MYTYLLIEWDSRGTTLKWNPFERKVLLGFCSLSVLFYYYSKRHPYVWAACWLRRGRLAINRYPLIYGFRAAAAAAADKEKFINIRAAIKVTV